MMGGITMRKFGKKYVEASKKVEKNKNYEISEAVKLAKETSTTKFDSSVELAIKLYQFFLMKASFLE